MSEAPKKYRGKARDLGITYISKGGAPMPEWARKGKVPPKGVYPELDRLGLSRDDDEQ
ncbi:MAG: hypothetical protein KY455_10050 [Euryarchaeota archaeon]|nr:hypothetical protein [Euryarchaeota archaeon]